MLSEIKKIVNDAEKVGRLLLREKKRRGVKATNLVFLGMDTLAHYHWCPMKALFHSKQMEYTHFAAYLGDRLSYAFEIGLIDELPEEENLLDVGCQISLTDINRLLEQRKTKDDEIKQQPPLIELQGKKGDKAIVLNPQLSSREKQEYREKAEAEGATIIDVNMFHPPSRGKILKRFIAEQHPTIRWSFNWKNYTIIGAPDGITKQFAYQFNTIKKKSRIKHLKPVAHTNADLYGYFFQRNEKKVQIYATQEKTKKTWSGNINKNRVEHTLRKFKALNQGSPPTPPQEWKCEQCQWELECTL